ncbi:MAG: hypothetical protein MJ050_01330 [Phascolarctobacterium sp.]|nr:hypothetical protein [Phascolarctobacterium sp.]
MNSYNLYLDVLKRFPIHEYGYKHEKFESCKLICDQICSEIFSDNLNNLNSPFLNQLVAIVTRYQQDGWEASDLWKNINIIDAYVITYCLAGKIESSNYDTVEKYFSRENSELGYVFAKFTTSDIETVRSIIANYNFIAERYNAHVEALKEKKRKEEEERRRREEEARRKAEEERKRKEEEAKQKAEEERKRKEEERRQAEAIAGKSSSILPAFDVPKQKLSLVLNELSALEFEYRKEAALKLVEVYNDIRCNNFKVNMGNVDEEPAKSLYIGNKIVLGKLQRIIAEYGFSLQESRNGTSFDAKIHEVNNNTVGITVKMCLRPGLLFKDDAGNIQVVLKELVTVNRLGDGENR